MNGLDLLVDTNVLIYTMEEHPSVKGLLSCSPVISVISEIELLGKKGITDTEINKLLTLLDGFPIVSLSDDIKNATISLKQRYTIKTPDAIIAATAQTLGLTLITADKGFSKIEDINVILLKL
jgi:predicted nucleic acid-binding protein